MRDMNKLALYQSYDLDTKIKLSKRRIQEWYEHWGGMVYISFSGGKDSTVLLHLVRSMYPEVPAVFSDTGLEFPEIREFVRTIDNVVWIKPKLSFKQVLDKYGYPVVSKEVSCQIHRLKHPTKENIKVRNRILNGVKNDKGVLCGKLADKWKYLVNAPFEISDACCFHLKKYPIKSYETKTKRKQFSGMLAGESRLRRQSWVKYGCNAFDLRRPSSKPLAIWTDTDIWEYIHRYNLKYSKIYDMGYDRTGCIYCLLGVNAETYPNRFQRLKHTHPKLYEYCMDKLNLKNILAYLNVPF